MSRSINPTFACLAIELEREPNGAAAVDPCGRVLAGAVAAAVVHRARFWPKRQSSGFLREIIMVPGNIMGYKAQSQARCYSNIQPRTHEQLLNTHVGKIPASAISRILWKLYKPKYCILGIPLVS